MAKVQISEPTVMVRAETDPVPGNRPMRIAALLDLADTIRAHPLPLDAPVGVDLTDDGLLVSGLWVQASIPAAALQAAAAATGETGTDDTAPACDDAADEPQAEAPEAADEVSADNPACKTCTNAASRHAPLADLDHAGCRDCECVRSCERVRNVARTNR